MHAEPVAALLRAYGLKAYAYQSLRWEDLKAEVAAGRPVIVWISGTARNSFTPAGAPEYYTAASDQQFSIVSRYEHTVILVGYDGSTASFLDGSTVYTIALSTFLESWSDLNFMAVIAVP